MIGSKDGYALVTGASSGIGYELAKLFAKDGKNIIVIARSPGKLEELKTEIGNEYGTTVRVLPKDLSNSNSPQEIFAELEKENTDVDVLVNNAGFTVWGMFSNTDWKKEAELIQVNITSLTLLTKLFLKRMLENGSGKILNVASLCGFISAPFESMYCASKSYVLHFSEALANELRGTGVSVTCLCPGLTDTVFHERANREKTRVANMKMMDAASVAEVGYEALKKGKVIAIPSMQHKLLLLLMRIFPRSVGTTIMRRGLEPV